MYTHNDFRISARVRAHTVAINVKRASVLDLISQATYINLKKLKNGPPGMAKGNQISDVVGTGPKATGVGRRHSGGPKAHKPPLEGLE